MLIDVAIGGPRTGIQQQLGQFDSMRHRHFNAHQELKRRRSVTVTVERLGISTAIDQHLGDLNDVRWICDGPEFGSNFGEENDS